MVRLELQFISKSPYSFWFRKPNPKMGVGTLHNHVEDTMLQTGDIIGTKMCERRYCCLTLYIDTFAIGMNCFKCTILKDVAKKPDVSYFTHSTVIAIISTVVVF